MRVRVSAMSANIKSRELGNGSADEAVQLFVNHPWEQEILEMRSLEVRQADSTISPNMTFTALPAHLIVEAQAADRFNVEVCLPRPKKFLGLISRVEFYTYHDINRTKVSEMIREFCGDVLESKHSYFLRSRGASA